MKGLLIIFRSVVIKGFYKPMSNVGGEGPNFKPQYKTNIFKMVAK